VAPLHKQTAYGLVRRPEDQAAVFASRTPLESLEKRADIESIADPAIRARLLDHLDGLKEGSPEWKARLAEASGPGVITKNGVRRVRIHIQKADGTMIGFHQRDRKGQAGASPYKYYELRGNYCAEIFCTDKGKKAGQWQCEIISNYHAHQKDFVPQWRMDNPTAKLIMRLHIDDMVAYEEEGGTVIRRVRKLNKPGKPVFVDHLRAKLEPNEGWAASSKQMQLKNVRKISVDILGRVRDPQRKIAPKAA
jgi:CRISPR-associated endonuclease Csn1